MRIILISVRIWKTPSHSRHLAHAVVTPSQALHSPPPLVPKPVPAPSHAAQAPTRAPLPLTQADDLSPQARRWLIAGVVLAHVVAGWGLLQVDAVRDAVREIAPTIMVDMIAPPEPPKQTPVPPPPTPQPRQVAPAPPPLIAAAPSPAPAQPTFVVPEPVPAPPTPLISPPAPPAPVPAPAAPAIKQVPPSAVRYLKEPVLNFPLLSKRAHESGLVVLRIVVDVNGRLKDARVHKSSGFERLDKQALQDMPSARFVPQMENGKPVEWETLAQLSYEF